MASNSGRLENSDTNIRKMPHRRRIMTLRRHHAEHLLEVLRCADKEEKERRKRLGHASSRADFMYLQKRFEAERLRTRRRIVNLLEDADAVEAAMLREAQANQPFQVEGDQKSANVLRESKGKVMEGKCADRQGGVSYGRRESNAFVGPQATEDPDFIDTEKMRFMKYAYKHLDDCKAAARRKSVGTKTSGVDRCDKLRRRRLRGNATGLRKCATGSPTLARAPPRVGGARGCKTECSLREVDTVSPLDIDRRRLLREKREILRELKGVIQRQLEALGRLAKGCENSFGGEACRLKPSDAIYPGIRRACYGIDNFGIQYTGTGRFGTLSSKSYPSVQINKTGSRPTAESSKVTSHLPPGPPDDATSTFLKLGGRWGVHELGGDSRRESKTTSASYATYCDRRLKKEEAGHGAGRRPRAVPALPIGSR